MGSLASSASDASSATSSCRAASRSRPWSRSSRARSVSSSHASARSRPLRTAASLAWGWRTVRRRWRRGPVLDQLLGRRPQALGDLLSGAEPDPRHQHLAAGDHVQVRIGGHQPECVECAVQDVDPGVEIILARLAQPVLGVPAARQRASDLDDRGPARRDGGRLRLRLSFRLPLPWPDPTAAFGGSEGRDHHNVGGGRVGWVACVTKQVAAVGWSKRPGQFDLDEAKQRCVRRCQLAPWVLTAYLLGAIGTTGSGIWLMRLIS